MDNDTNLGDLDFEALNTEATGHDPEKAARQRVERTARKPEDWDESNEREAELPTDYGCSSCEAIGNPEHADRLHDEIRDLNLTISRLRSELKGARAQVAGLERSLLMSPVSTARP